MPSVSSEMDVCRDCQSPISAITSDDNNNRRTRSRRYCVDCRGNSTEDCVKTLNFNQLATVSIKEKLIEEFVKYDLVSNSILNQINGHGDSVYKTKVRGAEDKYNETNNVITCDNNDNKCDDGCERTRNSCHLLSRQDNLVDPPGMIWVNPGDLEPRSAGQGTKEYCCTEVGSEGMEGPGDIRQQKGCDSDPHRPAQVQGIHPATGSNPVKCPTCLRDWPADAHCLTGGLMETPSRAVEIYSPSGSPGSPGYMSLCNHPHTPCCSTPRPDIPTTHPSVTHLGTPIRTQFTSSDLGSPCLYTDKDKMNPDPSDLTSDPSATCQSCPDIRCDCKPNTFTLHSGNEKCACNLVTQSHTAGCKHILNHSHLMGEIEGGASPRVCCHGNQLCTGYHGNTYSQDIDDFQDDQESDNDYYTALRSMRKHSSIYSDMRDGFLSGDHFEGQEAGLNTVCCYRFNTKHLNSDQSISNVKKPRMCVNIGADTCLKSHAKDNHKAEGDGRTNMASNWSYEDNPVLCEFDSSLQGLEKQMTVLREMIDIRRKYYHEVVEVWHQKMSFQLETAYYREKDLFQRQKQAYLDELNNTKDLVMSPQTAADELGKSPAQVHSPQEDIQTFKVVQNGGNGSLSKSTGSSGECSKPQNTQKEASKPSSNGIQAADFPIQAPPQPMRLKKQVVFCLGTPPGLSWESFGSLGVSRVERDDTGSTVPCPLAPKLISMAEELSNFESRGGETCDYLASGISITPANQILVTDIGMETVKIFQNRRYVKSLNILPSDNPKKSVMLPDGRIAVSCRNEVKLYRKTGVYEKSLSAELECPQCITLSPNQRELIVGEFTRLGEKSSSVDKVHVFDSGTLERNRSIVWRVDDTPISRARYFIVNGNGDIIASDHDDHTVKLISWRTGNVRCVIGGQGMAIGEFFNPAGLCLDRYGNIIVADSGNHRVQVLSAQGEPLGVVAGTEHDLQCPMDVAVDNKGHLVVLQGDGKVRTFRYIFDCDTSYNLDND